MFREEVGWLSGILTLTGASAIGFGLDTDAGLKFQELILPQSLNLYIGLRGSVMPCG